jgi:hypothetical protein
VSALGFDVGPYIGGIRWRRCTACLQRVWETRRGKLSRHVRQSDYIGVDAIAASSLGHPLDVPRCEGSGS